MDDSRPVSFNDALEQICKAQLYSWRLPCFVSRTVERVSGSAEPANQGKETTRILRVRKVLRNQYLVSRYPQIQYYILYISLLASHQTYCTEYETPVHRPRFYSGQVEGLL